MRMALTMDIFLRLLLDAARECGEDRMAEAIEAQGPQCHLFMHCRHPLSVGRFSDALDEKLRVMPGFKPDFRTPSDRLEEVHSVSDLYQSVRDTAQLFEGYVAPLQLALTTCT